MAPAKLLVLLGFTVFLEITTPVKALCGCAERFAGSADFSNTQSTSSFTNDEEGQTIVFTSAAFHCETRLESVKYLGMMTDCSTGPFCDMNPNDEKSEPMLQLWRMNDTFYNLVESATLTMENSNNTDLGWPVKENDVIGLWVPSSCLCETIFSIGYSYKGSRLYRIDGEIDYFDPMDYSLEHGPLPLISVATSDEFNVVCIIGLPAGALVAIIALAFTCAGICWSIVSYNKSIDRTRNFQVTHPVQSEPGTELNQLQPPTTTMTNTYDQHIPSTGDLDTTSDTISRPIYRSPLPPIPSENGQDVGVTSQTSSPPMFPQANMSHSLSNPDLTSSAARYGNIDPRMSYRSLNREPVFQNQARRPEPQVQPAASLQASNQEKIPDTPPPPSSPPPASNLSMIGSLGPQTQNNDGENQVVEQSYDRNSEYSLPDENSSDGGEVHDEYMSMENLKIHDIDNSGSSNDIYY